MSEGIKDGGSEGGREEGGRKGMREDNGWEGEREGEKALKLHEIE